jgi:hypothetical protein
MGFEAQGVRTVPVTDRLGEGRRSPQFPLPQFDCLCEGLDRRDTRGVGAALAYPGAMQLQGRDARGAPRWVAASAASFLFGMLLPALRASPVFLARASDSLRTAHVKPCLEQSRP